MKRSVVQSIFILALVILFQNCGSPFEGIAKKSDSSFFSGSSSNQLTTSSVVQCPAGYMHNGNLCIPPGREGDPRKTRFGILYMLWHCPFSATAQNNTGSVFDLSILLPQNKLGPVGAWHWFDQPLNGYYCLSQDEATLKNHAILLRDAGIDFIIIDSTNHPTTDGQSDRPQEMIVQPFKKLLEVWSRIPGAPRVVPWVPVTNATNAMVDHLLALLNTYPELQFIKDGKPYFLVTSNPSGILQVNPTHLSRLAQSHSYDKMWAINTKVLEPKEFSYLSPCQASFKGSGGTVPCHQFITQHQGAKEHVSISTAVNQFIMSESSQSTPRLEGRTLAKQFETLFNNPTIKIATLTAFNEWLAIHHCMSSTGALTTDTSKCISARGYFVDGYDKDYSRDIEPSKQLGDKYYRLTKSCISRYRRGMSTCDYNSADEVKSIDTKDTLEASAQRACAYPGDSNIPSVSATNQILGHVDGISAHNGRLLLRGWVCRVGISSETDIHLYFDAPAGKGEFAGSGRTHLSTETSIHQACGTSGSVRHRYEIDVTDWVGTHSGRSLYVHGINPDNQLNYYIYGSGSCSVPWPTTTAPVSYSYAWTASEWGACTANPKWKTGEWSACSNSMKTRSVTCDNKSGVIRRTAQCKRNDGVVVEDARCSGARPSLQESCEKSCSGAAPSSQSSCTETVLSTEWEVSPWSACSAQPDWRVGEWGACNNGLQSREVMCHRKEGQESRSVICRNSSGATVNDQQCSTAKPVTARACSLMCATPSPLSQQACEMPLQKHPVHRFYNPSSVEHFFLLNPTEAQNAGFQNEGIAFYAFSSTGNGLQPIYRCWIPNFKHFVSTDAGCEGMVSEGALGFLYSTEKVGTVPVYRKYNPTVRDHLVTLDRNEGVAQGYEEVSILGYAPIH